MSPFNGNFYDADGSIRNIAELAGTGTAGQASMVTVGTTTTGNAGTEASVVNRGTETDLVLDFVIPRGEKGEQGERGDTGATGATWATGAAGAAGKDGGSVTAISFSLDADGHVTGGTATLSDGGTVSITVTEAAE